MPRRQRCVIENVPHHITQRGVDRCPVFETESDRLTYLRLLRDNQCEAQGRLLGWCLMTNHVHLVILPERADSLALLLRRVHGCYAQYFNVRAGRTGHLWQNRYFACALGPTHVARALAYVDCNPVRARMVERAVEYPWSSAAPHTSGEDPARLLDLEWWRASGFKPDWHDHLRNAAPDVELEQCTYAGRPMGDTDFVIRAGRRFGRQWTRGRPKNKGTSPGLADEAQGSLFID